MNIRAWHLEEVKEINYIASPNWHLEEIKKINYIVDSNNGCGQTWGKLLQNEYNGRGRGHSKLKGLLFCFVCNKLGHITRKCYHWKRQSIIANDVNLVIGSKFEKLKELDELKDFLIESQNIKQWYMDNVYSIHVMGEKYLVTNMT